MGEYTKEEFQRETNNHIKRVQELMNKMVVDLQKRSKEHDKSKLVEPELSGYTKVIPQLRDKKYGTPEYHKVWNEARPTLDHHYKENRHHPQHFKNGIQDMTLVDLMEMISDWTGASERSGKPKILSSMDSNQKRFKLSDEMRKVLENTIKEYFIE